MSDFVRFGQSYVKKSGDAASEDESGMMWLDLCDSVTSHNAGERLNERSLLER